VAVAILVVIWFAFTFPAFTGKARFPMDIVGPAPNQVARPLVNAELGDAVVALYPWDSYLGERLRAGHLPLWDPYRFGGTAFAAEIATGTFYPPNWLYASGHVLFTFTFIAVASLLGALLMAYWFFRKVALHPYAAAAGAVVFTFSAFLMKWSSNEHVFGSAIWLPLALGGLEVARQGRARRGMARQGRARRGILIAAAALALSVLAGQAQIALIVWLATAVWAGVGLASSALARRRSTTAGDNGRLRREAMSAVAAFALAAGLAAVQLLPTAQFSGLIVRQETTFAQARLSALPVRHAPTLVLPDYLGSPLNGNYAGAVNYTETALYAGLLTLPLAVLGLLKRPGRLAAFFGVITLIGVLATLGTPFYRLILALPGFSRTANVARFILLIDFGLAGLAAIGLHSLIVEPTRRSVALVLAPLGVLVGVLAVLTVHRMTPLPGSYIVPRGVRALGLTLVGGAVVGAIVFVPSRVTWLALGVLGILAVDLWLFAFPYTPYQSPRPVYARSPAVTAVASVPGPRPRFASVTGSSFSPNWGLQYRLYGIEGYDPFIPTAMVELVGLADDQLAKAHGNFFGPFKPTAFQSPVMDLLAVRTAAGPGDAPLGSTPTMAGTTALFDRPSAFPPAFLTSCWEVRPEAAVVDRLGAMTSPELRSTAIIDDSAAARRQLPDQPAGTCRDAGTVTVGTYQPERVVARTQSDVASVLVLSDAWFPGWEVRVDGKRVPLLRVDHALRAVALPAGSHAVEFDFRPPLVAQGGAVTGLTLLFMMGWSAVDWRKRHRHPVLEGKDDERQQEGH